MPERFDGSPDQLAAYKAGQIDQRLDNHDEHLAAVNGSIADSAEALSELVSVVVEVKTKVKVASWLLGACFTAFLALLGGIAYLVIAHAITGA